MGVRFGGRHVIRCEKMTVPGGRKKLFSTIGNFSDYAQQRGDFCAIIPNLTCSEAVLRALPCHSGGAVPLIYCDYIDEIELYYVYSYGAFELPLMHECMMQLAKAGVPVSTLSHSVVQDLSDVDLTQCSIETFRRHVARRVWAGGAQAKNHVAYYVGSLGCYGMLRMYGALAEAADLRGAEHMFYSTERDRIAAWMSQAVGANRLVIEQLIQEKQVEARARCAKSCEKILYGPGVRRLLAAAA
jgi:hypothetical protein